MNDSTFAFQQRKKKTFFQHHGTFVECGALDGETRSNSLFLEMELDWSGILIEADPKSLQNIRLTFSSEYCTHLTEPSGDTLVG